MKTESDNADAGCSSRLARISDALGVPLTTFFDAGQATVSDSEKEAEAYLLHLIAAFLRDADAEARRRFVTSIEAVLQVDTR